MVSASLVRAVMVALTISATAQATWVPGAAEARDVVLVDRQADNNTSGTAGNTTPTAPATTNTPVTSQSTPAGETTPTTPTPTPTPTADPTTSTPTTTPPTPTPSVSTPGQTTTPPSSNTTPTASQTTTTPPVTSSGGTTTQSTTSSFTTSVKTTLSTTDSEGRPTQVETEVPTVLPTVLPIGGGGDGSAEQGQKTQQIIIGVCVGVGGAIVLGVAGVLFWRLRNKRRQEVDQDELQSFGTGYGAPSTAEKTEGTNSTRSPFQSTLESYHAPTQTNTASNF